MGMPPNDAIVRRERTILFLVAAVQFINICDFMMLAPLGPQLARSIGMAESKLANATAAYTFAAGLAGIAGSFFLDRFDRRKVLAVSMLGLVVGTAAGGFATDFASLVVARMFAGAFGGPATAISLAIVADVVPEQRRGKAMGAIMGAFAAAAVIGVPLGIALSEIGSWRTPLFVLAGAGAVLAAGAVALLPPLRLHLEPRDRARERAAAAADASSAPVIPLGMLTRQSVIASYTMTAMVSVGAFLLMPNIATYVQNNLGLPTSQLKYMYLAGGVVSFFVTRATGKLVDRFGTVSMGAAGTVVQVVVVYLGFANAHLLPWDRHYMVCMYGIFMSFMLGNGMRNVAYSTLTSRVPRPFERARFMSLQSSVQHLAAAAGASLSARFLSVTSDHALVGFDTVSYVSIAFALSMPLFMRLVERRVIEAADPALPLRSA